MIRIESRQNAALRHLARLGRERKYRRSTGEMLCEGEKMLAEAAASGARVTTLLVREGEADRLPPALLAYAERTGAALYCAQEALFRQASEVETPQRVIFSCAQPQWTADALAGKKQVLLLDGLQDPGNLGTILRTAEAFALGAVVLCEGCADPFSPKVVRSTMGAVFRLPCVQLPLDEAAARLARSGPRPVRGFFALFGAGLGRPGELEVSELWDAAARSLPLRGDEYEALSSAGRCLGRYGADEQLSALVDRASGMLVARLGGSR